MNRPIVVAYHSRTDRDGWSEVCRYPIESDQWSKQDRVFINEMLTNGHMVLTCGWNMWNIVKDKQ